jgi:hypothetical protein
MSRLIPIAIFAVTIQSGAGVKPPVAPAPAKEPIVVEVESKLKALHAGMLRYLEANEGVWPQITDEAAKNEDTFWKFWKDSLRPYGVPDETWTHSESEGKPAFLGSGYSSERLSCFGFKTQPWFMSIGGVGAKKTIFILSPDGDVELFKIPTAEEAKRQRKKPVPPAEIPENLKKFAPVAK